MENSSAVAGNSICFFLFLCDIFDNAAQEKKNISFPSFLPDALHMQLQTRVW